MNPTRKGIIVYCDPDQKETIKVGGKDFRCALKFGVNYREKSQVVATVIQGNAEVSEGVVLICHHNLFYGESPWALGDNLFSIPVNENLFALIDSEGNPHCIGGNVLAERVLPVLKGFSIPESYKKAHNDRVVLLEDIYGLKKGQQVFTKQFANYEVVYHWNGKERRVIKIKYSDIVAVLKT